jgi:hypothetical protein
MAAGAHRVWARVTLSTCWALTTQSRGPPWKHGIQASYHPARRSLILVVRSAMTIREYLWRKLWIGHLLWAALFAAAFVVLVIFDVPQLPAFAIMLVVVGGGFGYFVGRVVCPICSYSFANRTSIKVALKSHRTNFCPHCGVSLDSPMSI